MNDANQGPMIRPLVPLPMDSFPVSSYPDFPLNGSLDDHEETVLLDLSYLNGQIEGSMSYNLLDMPPEMYETFSQIEPISVIMNPGFDIY